MTVELETLQKIPEDKPVRVFLPISDSKERYRANCVFNHKSNLNFFLNFKAGALPIEAIDEKKSAIVIVDLGGPNVSLEAAIVNIISEQQIEFRIESTVDHEQLREFFRVDATTKVFSTSLKPAVFGGGDKTESWEIPGETIDISGSGILAIFPKKLPDNKQLKLKIMIPDDIDTPVSVLAQQVRSQEIAKDKWEVAFHFNDINSEDRDRIMGYCFTIQRELLRLKVRVKS